MTVKFHMCPVSSVDRAMRYEREGREFDSLTGCHKIMEQTPHPVEVRGCNPRGPLGHCRFESCLLHHARVAMEIGTPTALRTQALVGSNPTPGTITVQEWQLDGDRFGTTDPVTETSGVADGYCNAPTLPLLHARFRKLAREARDRLAKTRSAHRMAACVRSA